MPRQPRQASQPPREVLRRPERPPPHPPPPGRPLPSLRPRPTCRPGPDDAVARGGDFARTLAFDVLLAPVVEIAQTTAFRLAFTIAFAYVIPVIPVAARELVLRGGLVPRQRTPVGKLVPDGQGLRVLGTEDFLIGG